MVASLYGIEHEKKEIWIFLEQNDGELLGVSRELISKSRQLGDQTGWPVVGLLLGEGVKGLADDAFAFGADDVWLIEHPALENFTVDAYSQAAYAAVMEGSPSILFIGATPNGRDLAGRLAVRFKAGLNADCTDLRLDPETGIVTSEVTGFGGGVLALLQAPEHRPQMSTVRPGVFPMGSHDPKRKGRLVEFSVEIPKDIIRTRIVERVIGEGVDLTQAPVLVCGGRGIEGNFEMMEELAGLLDGEVGATRPPVDDGYIERERQVGQTGVVCRPKIAFACGISGAFHFVVGIQDADVVIAINTDPEAPIYEFSDYCIEGDVSKFIPFLLKALREEREVANV
jgi:electron transfer flavoprotein alpha subunit